VATHFDNDTEEGELLLSHKPLGRLSGTIGGSFLNRRFNTEGEEALSPPIRQRGGAGFLYEELVWPHATVQFGGRVDHTAFAPEQGLPERSFNELSGSVGLLVRPAAANDRFVVEARQVASSRIAADRASLPSFERDARAGSASAATVIGAADAFLSYGDMVKAESLYTIALNKPGANRDLVLTRLGIAQVDQGKTADALATFAKVQGQRKAIAQLWSAYARQKGGGA
jgi:hypothetical protein